VVRLSSKATPFGRSKREAESPGTLPFANRSADQARVSRLLLDVAEIVETGARKQAWTAKNREDGRLKG